MFDLFGYSALRKEITSLRAELKSVSSSISVLEKYMHEQFEQLRQRLDKATSDIAAKLQKLADQISGGLSASEAEKVLADLNPLISSLETMGKDETNPVP